MDWNNYVMTVQHRLGIRVGRTYCSEVEDSLLKNWFYSVCMWIHVVDEHIIILIIFSSVFSIE